MARTYSLADAGIMLDVVQKDIRKAAMAGVLAAAHCTVSHIVTVVIPSTDPQPVDRGMYRGGWRAKATSTGALIYNVAPHSAFIEFGVRGSRVKIGRAMIEALAAWARRKGIGARTVVGRGGSTRQVKASKVEATSIAWAIAKSMQEKGIFNGGKGLRVLERAEKMIPSFISAEVKRELSKL